MTGSTHIAVGITCSLAILQPKTIPECLCAITGGMIGGMISDIDNHGKRKSMDYRNDPYGWQVYTYTGLVLACLFVIDYFSGNGAVDFILTHFGPPLLVGIIAFLGLCFYGAHTHHRTFTHSILAGVLFTLSIWCFCKPLAIPFAIGFASHVIIDFVNRKKIQYFWPLSIRIGLNKYPSDGRLNDTLNGVGTVAAIYLSVYFIITRFAKSRLHEKMVAFFSYPVSVFGLITVPLIIPYLVIINIFTFFLYYLDYHLYMRGLAFYRGSDEEASAIEEFTHTIYLIFAVAGGMLGMLLAVTIILKGKIYKAERIANFNFYIIPICILICWVTIIITFFLPATTNWAKPLALLRIGSIPIRFIILGYLLIINVLTFIMFPRMQRFAYVITPREKLCVILSLIGGATGGYLSMKITGNHQNANMLASTLPEMIIMHAIVFVCTFFVV